MFKPLKLSLTKMEQKATLKLFHGTKKEKDITCAYSLAKIVDVPHLHYRVKLFETAVLKHTWCQRQTEWFDSRYI